LTGAREVLRCRLPECPNCRAGRKRWYEDLLAEIAEEVLPERRKRVNRRVIKRKMSNRRKKRPEQRHYPQPTKKIRDSVVMLNGKVLGLGLGVGSAAGGLAGEARQGPNQRGQQQAGC
jgi:hypothetical protein